MYNDDVWHHYHLLFIIFIFKNLSCICHRNCSLVYCVWHNHIGRKTRNNRAFTERSRFHCPCGLPIYGPLRLTPTGHTGREMVTSPRHIIHYSSFSFPDFCTILSVDPALCSYTLYKIFRSTDFYALLYIILSISVSWILPLSKIMHAKWIF